jgi:glycosyltransferase involved in cell wall biosynthesis
MNYLIACGIMPPEIGGPASVIPDVARDLISVGHRVKIITYTPNPTPIGGVNVVSVPREGNVLIRYLRFARALRSHLAGKDIVFATDVFSVGIPVRLALMGQDQKLILRLGGEWRWEHAVHSGRWKRTLREFWKQPHGLIDWLSLMNYRWILKRTALVITTSDLLKELLEGAFSDLKLRFQTVANISAIQSDIKRYEAPHDPLRLIYAGRFEPVKNVPFLARVLRRLYEEGHGVACTFVGDGADIDACKVILQGVPNMDFKGPVKRDHLVELFQEHDIHVLPSLSDICPNSVVEALASGLPCIISSETGLPRPLHGVLEVDPTDENSWVTAIREMQDAARFSALAAQVKPIEGPGVRLSSLLQSV